MDPIPLLLVDDNSIFLNIATRFLQEHEHLAVVGTATCGREALAKARDLQPQVVLVDLAMPDLPGLKVIPLLRAELPDARIIALTMLDTDGYREAALRAGAEEFVAKSTMNSDLVPAILRLATAARFGGAADPLPRSEGGGHGNEALR